MEEQRRLRSNVRMRRHRNRSSDNVRALRSQADRERKRTARQQATESRRSQHVSARGLICACVYLVKLKWLLKVSLLWQTQRVHKSPQRTQCPWKMPSENPGRHRYTCTVIDLGLSWYSREILFLQRYYYTQVIFRKLKKNTDLPEDYQSVIKTLQNIICQLYCEKSKIYHCIKIVAYNNMTLKKLSRHDMDVEGWNPYPKAL